MFRLQATITRQAFQYIDMTCSVLTCHVHVLKYLPDDGYLQPKHVVAIFDVLLTVHLRIILVI